MATMSAFITGHRLVMVLVIVEMSLILGFSQANPVQVRPIPSQIGSDHVRFQVRQNVYPSHHQMKRDSGDDDNNTLRMTLILVFSIGVILTLLVVITICAVCMLHRARYGEFCCIKPKLRHLNSSLITESDGDNNEEGDESGPPRYDCSYLTRESPPVYTDALQDAVLAKGIDTSTIPLPPYSHGSDHEQEDNVSSTSLPSQQEQTSTNSEIDTTVHEGSVRIESESSEPKALRIITRESQSTSVAV